MNCIKFLILFFIFNIFIVNVKSQEIEIKGQVFNIKTQEPVADVKVSFAHVKINALTDTLGFFSVKVKEKNSIDISFEHPLFEKFTQSLSIIPGIVNDVMVFLKPLGPIKLPETVIYDTYLVQKPFLSDIMLEREFENMAVRDIGDLMRRMPNVSGIRKGGANIDPVIRGFKYSQINVLINGAQQVEGGCPNRMDPATSRVDAEDIERLEVYKGPFALRYGASLGGTVNLVMKQSKFYDTAQVHVKGIRAYESNWNGHKEHLSISGANKYVFFKLSGNRWNYGNYQDGNGDYFKSAFKKYNYSAKVGGNYKDKYEFLFGVSQAHHEVLFPALPMDETDDNSILTYVEYKYNPRKEVLKSICLKGYQSYVHHIMDNKNRPISDTVVAVSDVTAITTGAKAESFLNLFSGNLLLGVDYQIREKYGVRYKNMIMQPMLPVKTEILWNDAVIENTALYTEYFKQIGRFDLILAVRYDNNTGYCDTIKLMGMPGVSLLNNTDTRSRYHNMSFSGGLTKNFNDDLSLGISLGRVSRSPDMLERFIILLPVGFDFYDYLGNPQLEPETNNEADLTLKYRTKNAGRFELNIFGSYVQSFIYGKILPPSQQMPLTQFVKGVKQYENGADVTLGGFELAYGTPEEMKLKVNLSTAFTYAVVTKSIKHVISTTENYQMEIQNDALNEIPPLEANLNISYPFFKEKFVPALSVRVVTAQNHVSEAFYEPTTPGFYLLNCSMHYKFNDFLNFNAGVNNILNKAYYEHLNRRVANAVTKIYEPGRVFYVNLVLTF